jgi:hypothetical protein
VVKKFETSKGSKKPSDTQNDNGWFWADKSILDLAREQGVRPIESIGEFAVPSLKDEDAEAVLALLDEIRHPGG